MSIEQNINMTGKKVLVVGAGKSGIASARLLTEHGADVVLYDGNEKLEQEKIRNAHACLGRLKIKTGVFSDELGEWAELVVMSPGVPTDLPFVERMREAGIPIWGEIELAYRMGKGNVIGITGTNGKTTTTTLVGEIMANFFPDTKVVGNIGIPYTDVADRTTEETVTVAEISSFQLETIHSFHPRVTAILNIQPDHLNRHHTMECYIEMKEAITKNQTGDDVCVLNYENPYTRDFGARCPCRVIWFSSATQLTDGYFYKEGSIYKAVNGEQTFLLKAEELNLVGVCNVENVMAAIAMTEAFGVPMDIILRTVREFKAVEHRIEYVATKRGVVYYNDSKATNPDAAIQGIRAMSKPTILIGGGYDKGNEYDEWIEAFDGKVKLLVLIGATREKIAETARSHGIECIQMADTFEEAFDICADNAVEGDAVLLSPACASWGMFDNYEQRGRIFKELVLALNN